MTSSVEPVELEALPQQPGSHREGVGPSRGAGPSLKSRSHRMRTSSTPIWASRIGFWGAGLVIVRKPSNASAPPLPDAAARLV